MLARSRRRAIVLLAGPLCLLTSSAGYGEPLAASGPGAITGQVEEEAVRFRNGELELAGALLTPASAAEPLPAVAFIHGAGESDRYHLWSRQMATRFAEAGFAFLLPDKRGSGQSAGDWRTSDFEDLAGDAGAAIDILRMRPEVDPRRIGVLGFSQGGRVAPIVGATTEGLCFVVNVSGSAVPFEEQVDHEMLNDFRDAGLEGADLEDAMALHHLAARYVRGEVAWREYEDRLQEALAGGWARVARGFPQSADAWRWDFFRRVIDYDPIPWWRRVEAPVLVVYGAEDERDNVPVAESVARLERAFESTGHPDATIRVLEGTGHGLRVDGSHSPEHRSDFLELLLDWTRARVEPGACRPL